MNDIVILDNIKNGICDEDWNNSGWQLSHRITTVDELKKYIKLTYEEEMFFQNEKHFSFAVTPYIISIMDKFDPNCPIRKQFIPTHKEFIFSNDDMEDSLHETKQSPVDGIIHRYKNRCLFLTTSFCSNYCRFCTRSLVVGSRNNSNSDGLYSEQLEYINSHKEIRDVILSGGDALLIKYEHLEYILTELRKMDHVKIIRIGTRSPIVIPQHITEKLTNMIKRFHPIWMNVHINHPKEFTNDSIKALNMLANAGIVLSSQSVLLKDVNDCPNIITELVHKCTENRVRPYYLYQCDLVKGGSHWRTQISKGIEIMESLRGNVGGLEIPLYIVDLPMGLGKVPVLPNYMISMAPNSVIFRNYKGDIVNYPQNNYENHDKSNCIYCKKNKNDNTTISTMFQDYSVCID